MILACPQAWPLESSMSSCRSSPWSTGRSGPLCLCLSLRVSLLFFSLSLSLSARPLLPLLRSIAPSLRGKRSGVRWAAAVAPAPLPPPAVSPCFENRLECHRPYCACVRSKRLYICFTHRRRLLSLRLLACEALFCSLCGLCFWAPCDST